jgi:predicted RNA-binding protein with EMAP domain
LTWINAARWAESTQLQGWRRVDQVVALTGPSRKLQRLQDCIVEILDAFSAAP